jgi:GTP-sensing pleiotropic transcriptional regulator CodY
VFAIVVKCGVAVAKEVLNKIEKKIRSDIQVQVDFSLSLSQSKSLKNKLSKIER